MTTFLYTLITILGLGSYFMGVREMLQNKYSPSTFSRVIWVLLAINSFAGVFLSNGTKSSILLAGILLLGNITICIVSFWKGAREMGKLEYFSLGLLLISGIIWIFFSAPLVNLFISLFAHFIGGLPTYKKVWINPRSESVDFWSLFFFASLLSIFASDITTVSSIIFPIYFTLFDGSMFVLALRRGSKIK